MRPDALSGAAHRNAPEDHGPSGAAFGTAPEDVVRCQTFRVSVVIAL